MTLWEEIRNSLVNTPLEWEQTPYELHSKKYNIHLWTANSWFDLELRGYGIDIPIVWRYRLWRAIKYRNNHLKLCHFNRRIDNDDQ